MVSPAKPQTPNPKTQDPNPKSQLATKTPAPSIGRGSSRSILRESIPAADLSPPATAGLILEVEHPPAIVPLQRNLPPSQRDLRVRIEWADVRPGGRGILPGVGDGGVIWVRCVARPSIVGHVRCVKPRRGHCATNPGRRHGHGATRHAHPRRGCRLHHGHRHGARGSRRHGLRRGLGNGLRRGHPLGRSRGERGGHPPPSAWVSPAGSTTGKASLRLAEFAYIGFGSGLGIRGTLSFCCDFSCGAASSPAGVASAARSASNACFTGAAGGAGSATGSSAGRLSLGVAAGRRNISKNANIGFGGWAGVRVTLSFGGACSGSCCCGLPCGVTSSPACFTSAVGSELDACLTGIGSGVGTGAGNATGPMLRLFDHPLHAVRLQRQVQGDILLPQVADLALQPGGAVLELHGNAIVTELAALPQVGGDLFGHLLIGILGQGQDGHQRSRYRHETRVQTSHTFPPLKPDPMDRQCRSAACRQEGPLPPR